jgi:hypothetical protein
MSNFTFLGKGLTSFEYACLISLLLIPRICGAVSFKASKLVGEARSLYGKKSILIGTKVQRIDHYSISLEKDWKDWFGSSSLSKNRFSGDGFDYTESKFDINIGRIFGRPANHFGIYLGISQMTNYFLLESKLKKIHSLGKGFGVRITSYFLSYEYFSQLAESFEIDDLSTDGTVISYKVSLNLGKKFKYGLYYLSTTRNFSGEYSLRRNVQGGGVYMGYQF